MPTYTLNEEYSRRALRQGQENSVEDIKLPPIDNEQSFHLESIWKENPFTLPSGIGWVDLCQIEKLKTLITRRDERKKKVYHQHTYHSRHASRTLPPIRHFFSKIDKEIETEMNEKDKTAKHHALTTAQKLRVRSTEKETTLELIQRKREMFLVNFMLQTKKNEISELKLQETKEEERISYLAERLRKEALLFDDFLKSTDLAAVDAMKSAEKETRIKIEKTAESRRMQARVNLIKGEMAKQDEVLTEYLGYKCFMLRFHHNITKKSGPDLTSEQWLERRNVERRKKATKKINKLQMVLSGEEKRRRSSLIGFKRNTSISFGSFSKTPPRKQSYARPSSVNRQAYTMLAYPEEWDEDEREADGLTEKLTPMLKDIKCIITIIHEKEEENLKLIYHFQASQDALDELKSAHKDKMLLMDREIARLKDQVSIMKGNIYYVEQRCNELQVMCKILGVGAPHAGDDDVDDLNANVEKVYLAVFGRVIVNIDALTMLTCIEKKMDQLIDQLDTLPEMAVRDIQKMKDRERRLAQREEKIMVQRKKQNERSRRATERANKNRTRVIGRKLIFRSAPTRQKTRIQVAKDGANLSESEHFF